MKNEDRLNGLKPKCVIPDGVSDFIGADGKLYPCCFVYSQKEQLDEWAINNNCNIEELDLKSNGFTAVKNSNFYKKFYSSFELEVCDRNCGTTGYETDISEGQPKWKKYNG